MSEFPKYVLNFAAVLLLSMMLAACGGGGGDAGSSGNGSLNASLDQETLDISGTPVLSITEGLAYAFVPRTSGAGGAVSYTILNKPSWAAFDTATGALTGTPGMIDIGVTRDIVITVSDGTDQASLEAFDIEVVSAGMGSATLTWQIPTENNDGSAILPGDLAGFKIHYGTVEGVYPNTRVINNPGVASDVVANLSAGTWFFVVTAFNEYGVESDYSNVASKTIPPS